MRICPQDMLRSVQGRCRKFLVPSSRAVLFISLLFYYIKYDEKTTVERYLVFMSTVEGLSVTSLASSGT